MMFGVYLCFAFLAVVYSKECHDHHSSASCRLEQLGCFNEKWQKRALPEEILNERDQASNAYSGKLVDWQNYRTYLDAFACRCAEKAAAKGYTVIGLQYYGECWSGPNAAETYHIHGISGDCINGNFELFDNKDGCIKYIGKSWTNQIYRIGTKGCQEKFEPIGCFNDLLQSPRPMPHYVMNDRDVSTKGFSGQMIEWDKWEAYSPKMICRCAAAASKRGDDYFSIQFWGECWSGKESDVNYKRNGVSTSCVNEHFKECKCNSYNCVGKENTNYVYKLSKVVTCPGS